MRFVVVIVGIVFAVALGGCGDEPTSEEYSADTRDAFLTACTVDKQDAMLVRDVCECTYEEVIRTVSHDDFVALEESLRLDTLTPLPDTITTIMADCFVDEADL